MLNIHRTVTELRDAPCSSIAGEKEQHVGADRWRRPAETEAVFDCADIFVNHRRSDAAAGSWRAVLFLLWTPSPVFKSLNHFKVD